MKDDIQKTALRLPRDLHTAVLDAAKSSGRTMNAEIVHRLQLTFELEGAGILHDPERGAADEPYLMSIMKLQKRIEDLLLQMERQRKAAKK